MYGLATHRGAEVCGLVSEVTQSVGRFVRFRAKAFESVRFRADACWGSRAGLTGGSRCVPVQGMGHPAPKPSDRPEDNAQDPGLPLRPWERLPREGDQAWVLFNAYRESGWPKGPGGGFVPRNKAALAEASGLTPDYLYKLAAEFKWDQRAGAWDRELDRRARETDLSDVEFARRRMLRRLAKLGNLAEMELDKLLVRATDPDLPQMTAKELVQTLEFVLKAERLMAEKPTEIVRAEGAWNLEDLSVEDLEALNALRKKAKGGG